MQKKRNPSNNQLNKWVQDLGRARGSSVQRRNPNHWKLPMQNPAGQYTVDIRDQGGYISYGTSLMPDVEGKNRADFYGDILDLNGKLNGSRIGRENGNLTLTREDQKKGLTPLSVSHSIHQLDSAHQVVLPELARSAKKHGVRFKNAKK